MRIRLTAGETVLNATLDDGHLPRSLAAGGKPQSSYEIGNIIYWSPGPDIAIFYDHDGQSIPDPGIIILGEIDSGADALKKYDGTVDVTIEAID